MVIQWKYIQNLSSGIFSVLNNQFLTGDQNLNYVNGTTTYLRILLLNISYEDGVDGPGSSTFQSPGWGLQPRYQVIPHLFI